MGDSDFLRVVMECGQISESQEERLCRSVFLNDDPSDKRQIEVTDPDSNGGGRSPPSPSGISKREMLTSAFRKSRSSFVSADERSVQDLELLAALVGKNLGTESYQDPRSKEGEEGVLHESRKPDSVGYLKAIFGAFSSGSSGIFQDNDILDIAAMKGIEFARPEWWRPGGYDEKDQSCSLDQQMLYFPLNFG